MNHSAAATSFPNHTILLFLEFHCHLSHSIFLSCINVLSILRVCFLQWKCGLQTHSWTFSHIQSYTGRVALTGVQKLPAVLLCCFTISVFSFSRRSLWLYFCMHVPLKNFCSEIFVDSHTVVRSNSDNNTLHLMSSNGNIVGDFCIVSQPRDSRWYNLCQYFLFLLFSFFLYALYT